MFKGQPKGLIAASFTNMGERFGFYVMMAILALFIQTKFDLSDGQTGWVFGTFYASIYLLALVGGIIADKTKKYKATIMVGLVLMTVGYALLAIPTQTPVPTASYAVMLTLTCLGLFVIAFGNGLFKGNLQALVGQMYDDEKYADKRDSGFTLFYMFINIGAIFAPLVAIMIRNMWVKSFGYEYSQVLPSICNTYLREVNINGAATPETVSRMTEEISKMNLTQPVADLGAFANEYLSIFTTGFHYAFAAAIVAMLISLGVYMVNKNRFPDPGAKAVESKSAKAEPEMSTEEIKSRIYALLAVFGVVIFFWFSFHQNGLTLTFFARDYTNMAVFSNINAGIFTELFKSVEVFQSFNPFFIVFLAPVVLSIFGWLKARGLEPSTPKKIAIGMGIAALAFVVMAIGSMGLPKTSEIEAMEYVPSVTPWLLAITYLILTVAELFISPLGISFVSKVAPKKYQGLMQGMWLGATAIGNQLLVVGAIFYSRTSMTTTWTIFVVACAISMFTMLFMVKWLERVTKA